MEIKDLTLSDVKRVAKRRESTKRTVYVALFFGAIALFLLTDYMTRSFGWILLILALAPLAWNQFKLQTDKALAPVNALVASRSDAKAAYSNFFTLSNRMSSRQWQIQQNIDGLESGKGLVLLDGYGYKLWEMWFQGSHNGGSIEGGEAVFSDTSNAVSITRSSTTETEFGYQNQPRLIGKDSSYLASASSSTQFDTEVKNLGSIVVQVKAPGMATEIVQFNQAKKALEFANAFNRAVADYDYSKTASKANLAAARAELLEIQKDKADCEAARKSLDSHIGMLDKEVANWLVGDLRIYYETVNP